MFYFSNTARGDNVPFSDKRRRHIFDITKFVILQDRIFCDVSNIQNKTVANSELVYGDC